MKTGDLVRALAADHTVWEFSLSRKLAAAAIAGLAISIAMYAPTLGPRPDIAVAIESPRFVFKLALMLLLAVSSVTLVARLARPAASIRTLSFALAIVAALLAGAVMIELMTTPQASWPNRLIGSNAILCLGSIPLLALPILLMLLGALRWGAPTRPGTTGSVAGLFAGALGAALYGTHCPDDSPLFVASWYSLAIGIVAVIGLLAGRRILQW
jgi:hypothetical protein